LLVVGIFGTTRISTPASIAVIVDVIANGTGIGSESLSDPVCTSRPSRIRTAATPSHRKTIQTTMRTRTPYGLSQPLHCAQADHI
jgi:hypothetical protein